MAADDQPWDLAQTAAPAAPPPPPPSAAPAAGAAPIDYSAIVQRLMQQPTLPQPDTTPVTRGLLSRLGEALGGGQTTGVMSPAQSETAGLRALRDFGTSLIAGSGYHPGQPALGAFATGFQGAEQSERGSEQGAAATLAAQQQYAAGQQQQYLERLKVALPLLQMQYGASIPNPLLSANTPAVPGTAGGAGKPGGGGVALTPFIAKNLPAGVTPEEDQMVRTVIGEAGGEPLTGQQGVAAVIKNRMNLGKQDAQSVIFAPNQFEPWNNAATRAKLEGLDPTSQQYQDVLNKAVRPVMSGQADDPTGGATNFYSPTAQKALGRDTPSWAVGQTPSTTIGGHQFYKLPFGPGTQYAGPGAPSSGPGGPAAPSTAPDTTTPPAATPAAPGEQTFEQFRAQNQIDPASLMPDLAGAKAAQAAAAQQLSLARAGRGGDPNKSLSDYNTATDAVNKLQQEANAKVLDVQRQLYDADQQRQAQAAIETKKIQAAATEADKQRQGAIDLENAKAGNQANVKLTNDVNEDIKNSGTRIDDLQLLRGLSDNVGTPTPLTSIKVGGRSLADLISATGFGGQDLRDKAGAVQAFHAGVLSIVRDLRSGGAATGEPRSNQDLEFVTGMAPSEWQDPKTRTAIISFLQQVNQRRVDVGTEYSRQLATKQPNGQPTPAGLALAQARDSLPPMVPPMPANLMAKDPATTQLRQEWFERNVKPGTFFRYPNGHIDLYKGPQ